MTSKHNKKPKADGCAAAWLSRYTQRGFKMLNKIRLLFALIVLFPSPLFAESEETQRLGRITEEYGRCANVVLGNFDTDKKAQDAAKLFYKEMIKNINSIIEMEMSQNHKNTQFYIEMMGKDVFTGYLLKSFTDVSENYQKEKKSLQEINEFDWKRTHKQLWEKYGCNAIYNGLIK